ncbi:hypothetical protein DMENIID0001_151830 [Sergentomyia squamirostris]
METIPVTLIVKAPNQQFEDQTIKCELSWTIKKLKGYLSEVYPCKPSTEEQKLIYSGQLLHDTVVLKDILRQYEGQETHTVHLVFTPKLKPRDYTVGNSTDNSQRSTMTTQDNNRSGMDSEGLRHRRPVNGEQNAVTNPPLMNYHDQQTGVPTTQGNMPQSPQFAGMPPQQAAQFLASQQLAYHQWLQQAYVDYMNQYMSLMTRPGVVPGGAMYPPQPQVPSYFTAPPQSPPEEVAQVEAAQPVAEPAAEAAPAQPRFPNLVRDDGPEQRDWLDTFYAFSRLMVLITLVYFYSSPMRCLIVVAIGAVIYLYHIGFFRTLINDRRAGGAFAPPAVPAAAAAEAPRANPPDQQNNNDVQQANANAEVNDEAASDPVVRDEANRTPVIAFLRTFVLSFFASLIPEAAAL